MSYWQMFGRIRFHIIGTERYVYGTLVRRVGLWPIFGFMLRCST